MLFSLSFLFSGLSEIVFAIANKNHLLNWAWSLVFGIITFMAGVLLLLNPSLTMTFLAYYIGFVILFRSISSISYAFDIKNYGGLGWGFLLFLGILGAVVSFILIWNPIFAGLSIVILVALNFLFGGLFNIYLALQLRKIHKYSKELSPELRERLLELENEIRNEVNS